MPRKRTLKSLPADSSDDDEPLSKIANKETTRVASKDDDSSSESDIENYLQPADKIDLSSSFFNPQKEEPPSFDKIEKNILAGVNRLTDSDSDDEEVTEEIKVVEATPSTSKLNFGQLHEYTKKMEELKRHVEAYNAKKIAQDNETDIENLLASGESRQKEQSDEKLNSSEFESCSDSEKEGWEEVKDEEKSVIPQEGLEITVDMPGIVKKKKDVDVLATIKRRINRVRKENQLLIHKVHLLCWLAHGNYLSSKINSENILAVALSLLPSEKSYPDGRTDLSYLEQLVKWYKNAIVNIEKTLPKNKSLEELLETQIAKKEAYNKKMLVYIFVAIIRALGIHCRLVLSFRVEPLRPPNSELLSLSLKAGPAETKEEEKIRSKRISADQKQKEVKERTKNSDDLIKNKETSKVKKVETKSTKDKEVTVKDTKGKSVKDQGTKPGAVKRIEADSKDVKTTSTKGKKTKQLKEDVKKVNAATGKSESEEGGNKKGSTEMKETKQLRGKGKANVKTATDEIVESESKQTKKPSVKEKETKQPKESLRKSDTKSATGANVKTRSETSTKRATRSQSKNENRKNNNDGEVNKTKKSDLPTKKLETGSSASKSKCTPTIKIKLQSPRTKTASKKTATKKTDARNSTPTKSPKIAQVDGANDPPDTKKPNLKKLKEQPPPCPVRNHPKRLKSLTKYCDSDSEDDFVSTKRPFSNKSNDSPKTNSANLKKLKNFVPKSVDVREDVLNLVKKSIKDKITTTRKRKTCKGSGNDSDYVPEPIKKKHHESDDDFTPQIKVKKRVQVKRDAGEETVKKKEGMDVWAEVFLENEEKWISVDVVRGQIHCVNELYARASHPVSYIVAWNNDNSLKDLTRKYCTNFNTVTRKLRIDSKWWEQTLKPFVGPKTTRDKEEDDELEMQALDKPLPTSIAEYKNHPLYVLKRHLLKYEALYPPDTPTLGFVRNEPVYSRQCVYTLHSRDIWLKHAKVVKPGEQPYKIVKARPRWDKLSNSIVTEGLTEIFGPWQTQDYEPPTAENGVVPRNAFGNVELFKPCMLPKKTVHLKLPGLNKIARRMEIDCAPALTGFDFHAGWTHPTYDGFVVCEEFADVLIAAWESEQEEQEKKEQEKIDKRVYGNWKRLIRGLLIRERLKVKYGESSGGAGKKKDKLKTKEK